MNSIERFLNSTTLSEGLKEDLYYLISSHLDEAWSGTSRSKQNYEDPEKQEEYEYTSKRVEMSPDEYIKRCARQVRRSGHPNKTKHIAKEMDTGRQGHKWDKDTSMIDHYAEQIKDKNAKVDEPYLFYTKDPARGAQDGIHRALGAKKAGETKIPVHIFHSTHKNSKAEQRQYKKVKRAKNKEIGAIRAENATRINRGGPYYRA